MSEPSNLAFAGNLVMDLEVERPEFVVIEGVDSVERHGNCFRIEKNNAFVNTGLNILLDRLFALSGPPAAVGYIGIDCDVTAVTAATAYLRGASAATFPNTTTGAISAAAATFTVASATGIIAGQGFTIQAGGGTVETGVVASIAGTTITPALPITYSHSSGTRIDFIGQIIKALGSGGAAATSRTAQTVTAGASFTNADFATPASPTSANAIFKINKIGLLNTATDAGTGLIDVIGGTGGTAPYNKSFSVDFTNAGTFTLTPQIAVTAQAA